MSRAVARVRAALARLRLRRCVMCDARTPFALDPRDRGLRGEPLGLCGPCFNDDDRLRRAVAFANAVWKRRRG